MATSKRKRYCEPCDKWVPVSQRECKACGADTTPATLQIRHLETTTPAQWAGDACRMADKIGLAMTVFSTEDLDMAFTINESTRYGISGIPPCNPEYAFLPLVTFLPSNYFPPVGYVSQYR